MVLTSINTIAMPVERVDFPSVTICGQGKLDVGFTEHFYYEVIGKK